jgi:DNA modification methylase
MLDRVVEISGAEGATYLDPFAGTGTGVIAAIKRGMNFLAGDIVEANCEVIKQRIARLLEEEDERD